MPWSTSHSKSVCTRLLGELAGVLERSKFRRYVTCKQLRLSWPRSPGGPTGWPTQRKSSVIRRLRPLDLKDRLYASLYDPLG